MLQRILVLLVLLQCCKSDRFTFSLKSRNEECFMVQMNARTTTNRMLFRCNVHQASKYDMLQVAVKSPSGIVLNTWKDTQGEHYVTTVRENGLYSFCFRKMQYAKKHLKVYFAVEFISTGSKILTSYPNYIGTLDKDKPTTLHDQMLELVEGEKVAIFDFDLHDVSPSIINEMRTRIMVQLSTEMVESDNSEVILSDIPENKLVQPLSWNSMKSFLEGGMDGMHTEYAEARIGEAIYFDVTDAVAHAITEHQNKIAFLVRSTTKSKIRAYALKHTSADLWPMLIFEDIGVETMHEISYFKENMFMLRGELSYIIHKERTGRDIVESTNSRIKWTSMLVNVVLIGVGFGQMFYVRHLLETSY